jgi:hypothetical protein
MRDLLCLLTLTSLAALGFIAPRQCAAAETAAGSAPAALRIGDLAIEGAWARATPSGATVAAGYLKITNAGTDADVLLGGATQAAERLEVHEMTMADGIMRMRPLGEGLPLEPGKTVELAPGGVHLMLLGLKAPLKEGERLRATLTFKRAGPIDVEFRIAPVGAASPPHEH